MIAQSYIIITNFQMERIKTIVFNKNAQQRKKALSDLVFQIDDLMANMDHHNFQNLTKEQVQHKIKEQHVFDQNGNRFEFRCQLKNFRKFGPGVYLLFAFLRHTIFLMAIATLLMLPIFFILLDSPYYKNSSHIVRLNLMRLTIASLQPQHFNLHVFLDISITLVFLIGMIVWKQKQQKLVKQCNKIIKLPSYLTVVIKNLPPNYNEQSMRKKIQKEGDLRIFQIYTARNIRKVLNHYKKLTENLLDLRVRKQINDHNNSLMNHSEIEKQKNFQYMRKKNRKILSRQFLEVIEKYTQIHEKQFNKEKYEPVEAYIVMKSYREKDEVLKKYQDEFNIEPCNVEPETIAWENIGIKKLEVFLRTLAVFFIVGFFVCVGCIIIFMLEILQTAAIGDAYHFAELSDSSSQCVKGQIGGDPCNYTQPNYLHLTFLILLAPFTIFVCKKIIMGLLGALVKFRKYTSHVSKIKSQIWIISFFYFIVSAVLHLCLYLKTRGSTSLSLYETFYPLIYKMFKLTKFNPASIHLYSDFSLDWYKQATFFIIIIGSTSFNIANLFKLILAAISHHKQKSKASKVRNLYLVKQIMHGVELHFETIYASCIAINYFVFLYYGCIPIVIGFGLINLCVLFCVAKWVFIRYGSKPPRISHTINQFVINIIFIGVIIHCLMTPIFLGAPGIAITRGNYKVKGSNGIVDKYGESLVQRYFTYGLFYIFIALVAIIYMWKGKTLSKCVKKILKRQNKQDIDSEKRTQSNDKILKYNQYFGLYPSYSMHQNDNYQQILKNMYLLNNVQAKRITCRLNPTVSLIISNWLKKTKNTNHDLLKQLLSVCYSEMGKKNRTLTLIEDIMNKGPENTNDNIMNKDQGDLNDSDE